MADELDAIERTWDVLNWTLGRIESFSKVYRIPLGNRMQNTLYDALDCLIEAKYTSGSVFSQSFKPKPIGPARTSSSTSTSPRSA